MNAVIGWSLFAAAVLCVVLLFADLRRWRPWAVELIAILTLASLFMAGIAAAIGLTFG